MAAPASHAREHTGVAVDAYVLETLMPDLVGHDRHPAAFLVYLVLWHLTRGDERTRVRISLGDLAEKSGLSKRSVQDALRTLVRRKLVAVTRESITAVPTYSVRRPWRRE